MVCGEADKNLGTFTGVSGAVVGDDEELNVSSQNGSAGLHDGENSSGVNSSSKALVCHPIKRYVGHEISVN